MAIITSSRKKQAGIKIQASFKIQACYRPVTGLYFKTGLFFFSFDLLCKFAEIPACYRPVKKRRQVQNTGL
jgi:hypothetical protein